MLLCRPTLFKLSGQWICSDRWLFPDGLQILGPCDNLWTHSSRIFFEAFQVAMFGTWQEHLNIWRAAETIATHLGYSCEMSPYPFWPTSQNEG